MNRKLRRAAAKQGKPVASRAPSASPGVPELFAEAVQHHHAGRLYEAGQRYREALAIDPRHADSLHLLGLVAYQGGRSDLAITLIGQAIAINANAAGFHASLGGALRAQGRLDDAAASYRRALDLNPEAPELHNNLGNVLKDCGKLDEAVAQYRRACAIKPDYTEAYFNLAAIFTALGNWDEAATQYQRAILSNPNYPEAHNNLGIVLMAQGKFDEAVAQYRHALALRPNYADAHCNLGNVLKDQEKFDEAVAQYGRALAIKPDYPEVCSNWGTALKAQGKLDEALAQYQRALTLRPNYAEAHYNIGNVLQIQDRLDEAVAHYQSAISLKPNYPEAHNNFGNALMAQGKTVDAEAHYQSAISLKSNYPEAHNNFGNALKAQGKLVDAEAQYRRAISLRPNYPEAHNNLGNMLKDTGALDEALAHYEHAYALKPDFLEASNNFLMSLHYSARHSEADMLVQAQQFAQQIERRGPSRDFTNTPDPQRVLRIGYVSADFREHPVAYFLARVLDAHDRSNIEVTCYSNSGFADAMTERLRSAAGQWRAIARMPDAEADELIRRDGIDVLIDLSGHTARNRLPLFALRPAPVQATWLGYFGTTGLAAMDYILADRFVVPPGDDKYYTEKIWRLPDSYLCFTPPDLDVPVAARQFADAGTVTLGCFNNWAKATLATVSLWAEVLTALPSAKLLLKTKTLGDPAGRQDAIDRFAAHGISAERLILEGASPRAELLAAYNRVDIALDPLPFGGGTTTAEALWMGVPVVTLRGDRFVGRVSESIMAAVGIADLVAPDRAGYVKTVADLAGDRDRLTSLHDNLRQMVEGSPICDGARFVRSLEAAYRGMWNVWCATRTVQER